MRRKEKAAVPGGGAARSALSLGEALLAGTAPNNAVLLLDCMLSDNEEEARAAVHILLQFFQRQLRSESFLTSAEKRDATATQTPEGQFHAWLLQQYNAFTRRLSALICRADATVSSQSFAFEALMECVRSEQAGAFSNRLYERVLTQALSSAAFNSELLGFLATRILQHADVSYYTYSGALRKIFESHLTGGAPASEDVLRNAFDVLCCVPPHFESIEEGGGDDQVWCSWRPGEGKETKRKRGKDKTSGSPRWADPLSRRKAFSDCWLAFLRIELPLDLYKKVLVRLHAAVIPHLVNPLLLSDFLTRAIDLGSLLGALALNGLFVLMTCHGLEYPQFYTRLYALLEPGVFLARSRKQFFELLDVFLRSTHLPAYLAAAFAKRLARLTLAAPPHGAMLAIGFVHNLLRRHPGCCVLIHREQQGAAARSDPFLSEESDPAKCCALESSLWELQALRQHYSPAVSRFVAVLERELGNRRKTQELDLALLCSSSYSTLFEEENGRRMKTVPLAFYEPQAEPTALFDFQEDELKAFAA